MKKTKILLAGGMKQEKAAKVVDAMKTELQERGIDADITFASVFETNDFSELEAACDIAVFVGTGEFESSLPVVKGLGLLYPYMGTKNIYSEIERLVSES